MKNINRIPIDFKDNLGGISDKSQLNYVNLPNTGGVPNGVKDITHPSVYYNPDGWNGYTHWMAATPYPQKDALTGEYYENPCIYFANGDSENKHPLSWTPIANNPLLPHPSSGYNSDPELFMHDNKLWVVNRWKSGVPIISFTMQSSSDGLNWTEPTIIYSSDDSESVSPMYLFENGKHRLYIIEPYKNPIVGTDKTRTQYIRVIESESLENPSFTEIEYCALEGLPNIWHGSIFVYKDVKYLIGCGLHDADRRNLFGLYLARQIEGTNDFKFYDKPLIATFGGYRPHSFVDGDNVVVYISTHNIFSLNIVKPSELPLHPAGNFVSKIEYNIEETLGKLHEFSVESV
jgi:hypothetical protein